MTYDTRNLNDKRQRHEYKIGRQYLNLFRKIYHKQYYSIIGFQLNEFKIKKKTLEIILHPFSHLQKKNFKETTIKVFPYSNLAIAVRMFNKWRNKSYFPV